jgi:2-C-methyl-D-erythritol 2,4-cyclodiphosphate synthase
VSVPDIRVGLGFDIHPFGGDHPLVIGGVAIPHAQGLAGHSDADVVVHAIADALLGAVGAGDLGSRFPATDERLRGASSIGMLREIAGDLAAEGYVVANVDVVVAAEAPPLAPHVEDMRQTLGDALSAVGNAGARPSVTVKPKRTEGLGAVGRGEGIAAWAVALLTRDSQPELGRDA